MDMKDITDIRHHRRIVVKAITNITDIRHITVIKNITDNTDIKITFDIMDITLIRLRNFL
jgi:hypothetical protein